MGSSSRLFTKPVITVNLDCDGAAVILGRAESIPNANSPSVNACDRLAAKIENRYPAIQVLVQIHSNGPLIYMSRTAQKLTGMDVAEMTESINEIMCA